MPGRLSIKSLNQSGDVYAAALTIDLGLGHFSMSRHQAKAVVAPLT